MITNGPGFQSPALPVDESVRSLNSQKSRNRHGVWNDADVGIFKPERWLKENGSGEVSFDPRAGPALPFGLGVRGCFGRSSSCTATQGIRREEQRLILDIGTKLAVIELKIVITLIVWQFELQSLPEKLGGFEAQDKNTHRPKVLYLRLKKVD
jgi:hypothetical protein